MSFFGALRVWMDLQNGQFNARMDESAAKVGSAQARINRSLATMEQGFNRLESRVRNTAVTLASGFLTVQFLRNAINAGDAMNDLSKRTGVAVETLSKLSVVAEQNGTNLDSVARGINFMQRQLGDAAQGSKTSAQNFEQLGLSIQQLRQLSPEDQFTLIIDRINQLGSESDRTKALMDVFGKSGAELAGVMEGGAAAIKEAMDQMERLGLVLSKDEADRMDEFNDKWTVMTTKLQRLAQEGFVMAYNAADKFFKLMRENTASLAGDNSVMELDKRIEDINARMSSVRSGGSGLWGGLLGRDPAKDAEALKSLQTELDALVMKRAQLLSEAYGPNAPASSSAGGRGRSLPKTPDDTASKKAASEAERARKEELRDAQEIYMSTRTAAELYAMEVDRLDKHLRNGSITQDVYNRALEAAGKEFEKADTAAQDLKDTASDVGLTFTSAFESAAARGAKLRDIVQGIVQDLTALTVRKAASEPFLKFFEGAFSGIFGGGRASGGGVQAGMLYEVGERGRELFAPGVDGTIIPHDALTGGGGGVFAPTINVNVSGGGGNGAANADLARQVARAVKQEVQAIYASETRTQQRFGGLLNPV